MTRRMYSVVFPLEKRTRTPTAAATTTTTAAAATIIIIHRQPFPTLACFSSYFESAASLSFSASLPSSSFFSLVFKDAGKHTHCWLGTRMRDDLELYVKGCPHACRSARDNGRGEDSLVVFVRHHRTKRAQKQAEARDERARSCLSKERGEGEEIQRTPV